MKKQLHIEIIRSDRLGCSSLSTPSCTAILAQLRQHFVKVGVTIINNSQDLQTLVLKQPDLVFMGMKQIPDALSDEKILVSQFLEQHGIAHTGSGYPAIKYEQHKPLAKQQVRAAGIPTADAVVLHPGQTWFDDSIKLQFPLFVKPASQGGGAGISPASYVESMSAVRAQVDYIFAEFNDSALVEEYLPGREFSVAILRNHQTDELEGMPIELIPPNNEKGAPILSQAVKSSDLETVLPITDLVLHDHVVATALDAFTALGARDYGRIDLRLDNNGVAHFLEANLIPCLIKGYGSFPKACSLNKGMNYETMLLAIVNLALSRAAVAIPEPLEPFDTVLAPIILPV